MKYTLQITIERSLEQVSALFAEPANRPQWQPGLLRAELLAGKPGEVGAQSKLVYRMGKREIEMIETVTTRDLPHVLAYHYDAKGVHNVVQNRFEALAEGQTRWHFTSDFQCRGLMRVMALLMPGAFKKESLKFMRQFKDFAERA